MAPRPALRPKPALPVALVLQVVSLALRQLLVAQRQELRLALLVAPKQALHLVLLVGPVLRPALPLVPRLVLVAPLLRLRALRQRRLLPRRSRPRR